VVGVLRVATEGREITGDEIAFLEVVAAQIAIEVYTLERRAFLQAIVDQSPAGQVVVEVPHGHVVLANQVAHEMWGRHLAPVVQDGITCSLVTAEDLGLDPLTRTLASGQGATGEEGAITRPDGSVIPVLVSTTALHTRPGEAQYVACTVHDLSGVKRVEALKDEFLSIVSHELRTPLTAAKGFVQLGLRRLHGPDPVQARRTFADAAVAISDLTALVEELLEFSRLQAGRFQINPEPLELRDLVEREVRHLRGLSERHRIEIHAPAVPVLVEGDYRRLEQVVTNLVGNAIKYSPRGGLISVTLAQHNGEVWVSVTDPGIGIPPDEWEQIFSPYFRGRNTQQRHFGGLGMGLYISRSIVEHHGGRIWVKSVEGEGTTITFSLPALPAMPV
jgi:PAS domain S-box-containing protein